MAKIARFACLIVLVLYFTASLTFAAGNISSINSTNNIQQTKPQLEAHQKPPQVAPLNNAYIKIIQPRLNEEIDGRWLTNYQIVFKWEYGGFIKGKSLEGVVVKIYIEGPNGSFTENCSIGNGGHGSYTWKFSEHPIVVGNYRITIFYPQDPFPLLALPCPFDFTYIETIT